LLADIEASINPPPKPEPEVQYVYVESEGGTGRLVYAIGTSIETNAAVAVVVKIIFMILTPGEHRRFIERTFWHYMS